MTAKLDLDGVVENSDATHHYLPPAAAALLVAESRIHQGINRFIYRLLRTTASLYSDNRTLKLAKLECVRFPFPSTFPSPALPYTCPFNPTSPCHPHIPFSSHHPLSSPTFSFPSPSISPFLPNLLSPPFPKNIFPAAKWPLESSWEAWGAL